MPDRETVIKAIEICYTVGHNCTECPLFNEDDCNDGLMRDALALLREQEPVLVEHKKVNDEYQAIEDEFVCKHCGAWWMIPEEDLKYCPGCGRAVKWNG